MSLIGRIGLDDLASIGCGRLRWVRRNDVDESASIGRAHLDALGLTDGGRLRRLGAVAADCAGFDEVL